MLWPNNIALRRMKWVMYMSALKSWFTARVWKSTTHPWHFLCLKWTVLCFDAVWAPDRAFLQPCALRKDLPGLQSWARRGVQDLLPEPRRRHLSAGELRKRRKHPAACAAVSGETKVIHHSQQRLKETQSSFCCVIDSSASLLVWFWVRPAREWKVNLHFWVCLCSHTAGGNKGT